MPRRGSKSDGKVLSFKIQEELKKPGTTAACRLEHSRCVSASVPPSLHTRGPHTHNKLNHCLSFSFTLLCDRRGLGSSVHGAFMSHAKKIQKKKRCERVSLVTFEGSDALEQNWTRIAKLDTGLTQIKFGLAVLGECDRSSSECYGNLRVLVVGKRFYDQSGTTAKQ